MTEHDQRLRMQDPRIQYPKPPFPRQPQPAPGLASNMDPQPDHGETSYRGTGRYLGRKALLTGGHSGIDRAAAISFAREGADVAIVYLPSEEPDAREVLRLIEDKGRKAVGLPADITSEEVCTALVRKAVVGLDGLDILVNNAGQQVTQESIEDITSEPLCHVLDHQDRAEPDAARLVDHQHRIGAGL